MSLSLPGSRANTAFRILKSMLGPVLHQGVPADAFLAGLFRQDKRFGSRDRRYIRDAVFAYFRWRGPVLRAFPGEEPSLRGVIAALLAEGMSFDRISGWFEIAGLDPAEAERLPAENDPIRRMELFTGKKLSRDSVLPEWTNGRLDPKFAEWFQKRPSVWIRSECADLAERLSARGIVLTPHDSVPGAFRCETPDCNLYGLEEYRKGLFELQDLSSQCIGLTAAPSPGEKWLDACAGAGGKTLQLLSLMGGDGSLTASDRSGTRLEELKTRLARRGKKIRTVIHDLTRPLPAHFREAFDGVLVDAPCSSSGRWRRNPELRWQTTPEQIVKYAELQSEILKNASSAVRPGGVLVYATCSVFREENENIIENFLNFHFDFELDKNRCILLKDNKSGMLGVRPWDADCDASFAARLHRKKLACDASTASI